MVERWTPDSWKSKPAKQLPAYPDPSEAANVARLE